MSGSGQKPKAAGFVVNRNKKGFGASLIYESCRRLIDASGNTVLSVSPMARSHAHPRTTVGLSPCPLPDLTLLLLPAKNVL
jgi:hypothetical protein